MILGIVLLLVLSVLFFVACRTWNATGRAPRGERLKRMQQLPYFQNGQFRNQDTTQLFTSKRSFFTNLRKFLFESYPDGKPSVSIPALKTDLHNLDSTRDLYVWLGHSTVLLQLAGVRYLLDPVLTYQLPVTMFMKPFPGTDIYSPDDLPDIDFMIITHDHWDHLDYGTVRALQPRVGKVICGIGMGEDFEFWGYPSNQIQEMVWNDSVEIAPNTYIHCLPARHFSGRLFSRNVTLWASYLIDNGERRVFVSGDGGYDARFKRFGQHFPDIDLAFMEDGQYNEDWSQIHLLPHLLIRAIDELAPRRVMPYHNSKFALSRHPWYEPLDSIAIRSEGKPWQLLTPRIGEVVYIDQQIPTFPKWWEEIKGK